MTTHGPESGRGRTPALCGGPAAVRSMLEHVYEKPVRPVSDRIAVAQLTGTVHRHAGWKAQLTGNELAVAVAELQGITKGRPDGPALMAEVAGLLTGAAFGIPLEEDKAILEAQILVAAGADEFPIDGWTCLGAERTASARDLPFGARVLAPGADPAWRPRRPAPGRESS